MNFKKSLLLASLIATLSCGASMPVLHAADDILAFREKLRPEHQTIMDDWEENAHEVLKIAEAENKDAESLQGVKEMRQLLQTKRLTIKSADELKGNWKVRSLQANNLGAYLYPFFKCSIKEDNGQLVFHKPTGSQRRYGPLVREEADYYFFAGGMYYDYDQVTPYTYSTLMKTPLETTHDRDAVGHLYKLGPKKLMMVIFTHTDSFELYELVK